MTSVATNVKRFGELIRFEHTLFALPWAIASAFLASGGWPPLEKFLWILAAMVGARTAAMTFNRLVDRRFDAENPRTKMRHSVTGIVSVPVMLTALLFSTALFFFAAGRLNRLALILAGPTLAVLFFYSVTKRFWNWTHVILGAALGLSPLGAWVAIRGDLTTEALPALFLSIVVLFWTAGFDILYACQDYDFDRDKKLHSVPARFGIERSLTIAKWFHACVPPALFFVGWFAKLGMIFQAMTAATAVLLIYEHRLVKKDDLSKLNQAFFGVNVAIGFVVMAGTVLSVLLRTRA